MFLAMCILIVLRYFMRIVGAITEVAKPSWVASSASDMTLPGGDDLLGETLDLLFYAQHSPLMQEAAECFCFCSRTAA